MFTLVDRGACALAVAAFSLAFVMAAPAYSGEDAQIERGRYLVTIGLCNDCHTPGVLLGKPDEARFLGGSDVGFEIPGEGVFIGRNLTPDPETGIGNWTEAEIALAIRTGERPDGRILSTMMPWEAFASLSDSDALAIAAYLKTLNPVRHAVPGPFGPGEKVTSFTFRVLPPGEIAAQAGSSSHD